MSFSQTAWEFFLFFFFFNGVALGLILFSTCHSGGLALKLGEASWNLSLQHDFGSLAVYDWDFIFESAISLSLLPLHHPLDHTTTLSYCVSLSSIIEAERSSKRAFVLPSAGPLSNSCATRGHQLLNLESPIRVTFSVQGSGAGVFWVQVPVYTFWYARNVTFIYLFLSAFWEHMGLRTRPTQKPRASSFGANLSSSGRVCIYFVWWCLVLLWKVCSGCSQTLASILLMGEDG